MAHSTFTLHSEEWEPDQSPREGLVQVRASVPELAEVSGEVVMSGVSEFPIAPDGTWSVSLPADDGTINPSGFHYIVTRRFSRGPSPAAKVVPGQQVAAAVVNLKNVQPSVAGELVVRMVGPKGDPGLPPGERVAVMGDSIAASGTFALHGTTWASAMCELSDQRLMLVGSTAVGGETSTQIAARIYDTLLLDPSLIVATGGANDLPGSLATYQANITTIADKARDADVLFVPSTITPLPNLDAGGQAALLTWNAWLRSFAIARQLPLFDFHALLTDGSTGFAAGYNSGDNIHPSQAAHVAMAALARDTLAARDIGVVGRPERRALGYGNLAPTPMFTSGSPVPTGWTWTPATGHTGTLVVDPAFRGKAFRIVVAGAAGGLGQFNTSSIPVTAGQKLVVSGNSRVDVSTASAASFKGLRLEAWWSGAPWVTPLVQGFVAPRDLARWRYKIDVPAGVTSMNLVVLVNAITGAETFTCHLGEFNVHVAGPLD